MFEFLKNKKLRVRPSSNKAKKIAYLSLGILFLFASILGSILPIIPGFVFILPAVYFLAKSSKRLHDWMKNNKYIGKYFHHDKE